MLFKKPAAKEAKEPEASEPADEAQNPPRKRSRRLFAIGGAALCLLVAGGGAGAWFLLGHEETETHSEPDSIFTSSHASGQAYDDYSGVPARPMPVCEKEPFENCIVDGDTFWLNGLKIRIANADAPASPPRCEREAALSQGAIATLRLLLDNKPIEIRSQGRDRAGRVLALIRTPDGDVGRNLIRFDVAVRWNGRSEPSDDWCAG